MKTIFRGGKYSFILEKQNTFDIVVVGRADRRDFAAHMDSDSHIVAVVVAAIGFAGFDCSSDSDYYSDFYLRLYCCNCCNRLYSTTYFLTIFLL